VLRKFLFTKCQEGYHFTGIHLDDDDDDAISELVFKVFGGVTFYKKCTLIVLLKIE
jgi:hypothetical protein